MTAVREGRGVRAKHVQRLRRGTARRQREAGLRAEGLQLDQPPQKCESLAYSAERKMVRCD